VTPQVEELAAHRAASRSHAYQLFAHAFGYPEGDLLEQIRSGRLASALEEALEAVSPSLGAGLDRSALSDAGDDDSLAVEYTRLFDVGPSGPPCPLHDGLWIGDRMHAMEEVLRFYQHFDLSLDTASRELPDHLTIELEFLHYLSFREAEAWRDGSDAGAYRRAERDFLARHPARWVPLLRAALTKEKASPFFVALACALEALLTQASGELA
jgi:DMSO reductase family type II enzyme chaperone